MSGGRVHPRHHEHSSRDDDEDEESYGEMFDNRAWQFVQQTAASNGRILPNDGQSASTSVMRKHTLYLDNQGMPIESDAGHQRYAYGSQAPNAGGVYRARQEMGPTPCRCGRGIYCQCGQAGQARGDGRGWSWQDTSAR